MMSEMYNMKFDTIHAILLQDGRKTEYGVIEGDRHIVVIKSGAGGSCFGYQDKYLRMANRLHETHGCTVICLPNNDGTSFENTDVGLIQNVISQKGEDVELYYVGNSNGATQGLLCATAHFDFRRMVLINMPLMLNFHQTIDALSRVNAEIRFVYGEKDPSYNYVPFLRHVSQKENCLSRVDIEIVPQANHNFVGMIDTFIEQGLCVLK